MSYQLLCVIPLYKTTPKLIMPLISSLARYDGTNLVFYKFYYDDTVPEKVISLMREILITCQIGNYGFDFEYCQNPHSGYKRNRGVEYAIKYNIPYIWFIDQDDWITETFAFNSVIEVLNQYDFPFIKINFTIPNYIDEYNAKTIKAVATMPWQYVFRTDEIKNYKFSEEIEYGSDIPFVIFYLLDKNYLRQDGINNFTWINSPVMLGASIYFYNYLNSSSVMGTVQTNNSNQEYNTVVKILEERLEHEKKI